MTTTVPVHTIFHGLSLGAAVWLVACGGPAPGTAALPAPDRAEFEEAIQPLLARRCASRTCHGDPSRTLLLFSVEYYRMQPEELASGLDEAALAPEELDDNYTALRYRMKGAAAAEETLLLRKTAAPERSWRVGHVGAGTFPTVHEPAYQGYEAWIRSAFDGS